MRKNLREAHNEYYREQVYQYLSKLDPKKFTNILIDRDMCKRVRNSFIKNDIMFDVKRDGLCQINHVPQHIRDNIDKEINVDNAPKQVNHYVYMKRLLKDETAHGDSCQSINLYINKMYSQKYYDAKTTYDWINNDMCAIILETS